MNADFTYDRDTDQFVVTLDDGTEVCRTRAPHTQNSKVAVECLTNLLYGGRVFVTDLGLMVKRDEDMAEVQELVRHMAVVCGNQMSETDLTTPAAGVKHAT